MVGNEMSELTVSSVPHSKCTGCGACANLCPTRAISMGPDDEGFLFPHIDGEKCVQCGLCHEKCPALSAIYPNAPEPACFAVWAQTQIRRKSSSGGAFTLLANHFFERGGAVAGAVFADDYRSVRHIVTRDPADLERLRMSKYLQSDAGRVYAEVCALLREKVPVLFVGTPCQVAGMRAVAGEDENLLTVDLACKSVPSTKAYNSYLDEIAAGREIASVSFRDKSLWGWSTSVRAEFKDGSHYMCAEWMNEPFYTGFLNYIINRESCATCPFAKIPRQGDITLADFWGVHKRDQSWDDRYGTGLVLLNSGRGSAAFRAIRDGFDRTEEMELAFATDNNPALVRPLGAHPARAQFFDLLDKRGYRAALNMAVNGRYDAGIIGFWIGTNYGTILTNYALNRLLKSKGLSVCMIDTMSGTPRDVNYPVYFNHRKEFEKKYYEILAEPNLTRLNERVGTFVLGSDQVWKYELAKNMGHMLFFDFVSDENRKISYAASFGGSTFNDNGEYRRIASYLMKRFDAVSVREVQGVDICRDQFGVAATQVLDPVFMIDRAYYDLLAQDSTRGEKGPYLFAYILDPSPQKREILQRIAKRLGCRIVIVLDCEPWRYDRQKALMGMDECVLDDVFVEDFVNLLSNAQAVVTDSFHGTAFSIIYDRPFIAIANPGRGMARFESLLGILRLEDRLVYPYEEFDLELRAKQLTAYEYGSVHERIEREKVRSDAWLDEALFAPRTGEMTLLNDKLYAHGGVIRRIERDLRRISDEVPNIGATLETQSHSAQQIAALKKELAAIHASYEELKKEVERNSFRGVARSFMTKCKHCFSRDKRRTRKD